MRNNTVLLLLCLLSLGQINAQDHPCGTTPEMQSSTIPIAAYPTKTPSTEPVTVPIAVTIVGAANGALALDSAEVFDEIAIVNEHFAAINIEFVQCRPINYVYDNRYIIYVNDDDRELCDRLDVPNAINIYFVPNIERADGSSLCGFAYNFTSIPRVLMDNGCATNGSTLVHELGHSFSLLHTHSTKHGLEWANGTNCDTAGDMLCDTPADPGLSGTVDRDCVYEGTARDLNGDLYEPDPTLLMSYSRKSCRTRFSDSQLQMMRLYYDLNGAFLNCGQMETDIEETSLSDKLEVFPNPVADYVVVNAPGQRGVAQILDIRGRLMADYQDFQNQYRWNISHLPSGTYMLRLTTADDVANRLIIKP